MSNLHYHLKKYHLVEYRQAQGKQGQPSRTLKSYTQPTITACVNKMTPLPRDSDRYKKLTKANSYFLCKDVQPFDTVNDQGHMINVFESRYTPPDYKTIASSYIPAMYQSLRDEVLKKLSKAEYFSITTDIWSSQAKHNYIAVTIHYLTESFELQSHLIETKHFDEVHT